MRVHSLCAALIGMTVLIGPVLDSRANTSVDAKDYSLYVTHTEISRPAAASGAPGLELQLNIENQGSHDLYDVRVYLQEASSKVLADRSEPARLRTLAAGESATVTYTFETSEKINGPLRKVVFRVEAVDQATKQIVTFNQKSTEAR
jgi:hypothetical protein